MPDREKVIARLEEAMLLSEIANECKVTLGYGIVEDALALLKAQETRVLALDEIHGRMVVWLEYVDKPEVELAIGGSSACGQKCFITEYDIAIHLFDDAYNRRWRAWTAEPTDEQRRAEPWQTPSINASALNG